jgi:hypothetical protein
MDSTAVILSVIFLIGLGACAFYWDELPHGSLAGAVTIDQQQLNLCMNACMRACVLGIGMEQECLGKCTPECGG